MAKRRFKPAVEEPVEQLTPEERRERRRRDRELSRKGKKPAVGKSSPWRRAALLGIPVSVIVGVVIVLLFFNPFQTPCVSFTSIPESSGVPDFPSHSTTDFSGTWCPPQAPTVYHVAAYLTISINGQTVGLPPTQAATSTHPDWPSIGRNSSFPGNYACNLPIYTIPPNPSTGNPDGAIQITSPWSYSYNLSNFFQVWSYSFSSVFVNSSSPNQPIVYQTGNLLGFTADSTHRVALFVDGSASSAGPNLVLSTLDYAPTTYPTCLGEKYGTGHVILLSYSVLSPAVTGAERPAGGLVTAGPDPMVYLSSFGGPLEKVPGEVAHSTELGHAAAASLGGLLMRPVPVAL